MGITIIGAGNMARGIGTRLVAAGETVTIVDRSPDKAEALAQELGAQAKPGATVKAAPQGAAIQDDTVVLALYYPVEKEVATQYRDQLAGKTVIEISNPLNATFDDLATPPGTSAAEDIAATLPQSTVVKAFNTTFAGPLVEGQVAGQPLDVFLASDDADAKARFAQTLQAADLRPLDVGPLKRARQLEGLGLLHITQQFTLNTGFGSAVKIIS
ncbi:MAG TPA: NAD(P)-binding domain-containing protein [Ktedonobacterales bacterium]